LDHKSSTEYGEGFQTSIRSESNGLERLGNLGMRGKYSRILEGKIDGFLSTKRRITMRYTGRQFRCAPLPPLSLVILPLRFAFSGILRMASVGGVINTLSGFKARFEF
jgi:hypothetical protein